MSERQVTYRPDGVYLSVQLVDGSVETIWRPFDGPEKVIGLTPYGIKDVVRAQIEAWEQRS